MKIHIIAALGDRKRHTDSAYFSHGLLLFCVSCTYWSIGTRQFKRHVRIMNACNVLVCGPFKKFQSSFSLFGPLSMADNLHQKSFVHFHVWDASTLKVCHTQLYRLKCAYAINHLDARNISMTFFQMVFMGSNSRDHALPRFLQHIFKFLN